MGSIKNLKSVRINNLWVKRLKKTIESSYEYNMSNLCSKNALFYIMLIYTKVPTGCHSVIFTKLSQ